MKRLLIWTVCSLCVLGPGPSFSDENDHIVDNLIDRVLVQIERTCPTYQGTIIEVREDGLAVDIGRNAGGYQGLVFEVYRKTDELFDPETGSLIGYFPVFLGTLRLFKVFDTFSLAVLNEDCTEKPVVGDLIVMQSPTIRLALYPLDDKTGNNASLVETINQVLRYRLRQTGRFEVLPPSFQANLPADPSDLKRLILDRTYPDLDYIISLDLTENGEFLMLSGPIVSLIQEQTLGYILVTARRVMGLAAAVSERSAVTPERDLVQKEPLLTIEGTTLDAASVDLDNDGWPECAVLFPNRLDWYRLFPEPGRGGSISLPESRSGPTPVRGIVGQIVILHDSNMSTSYCFIRTSLMKRGIIYQIIQTEFLAVSEFDGYPLSPIQDGTVTGLVLADFVSGKGLFQSPLNMAQLQCHNSDCSLRNRGELTQKPALFRDVAGIGPTGAQTGDLLVWASDYTVKTLNGNPEMYRHFPRAGVGSQIITDPESRQIILLKTGLNSPDRGDHLEILSYKDPISKPHTLLHATFNGVIAAVLFEDFNNDGRSDSLVFEIANEKTHVHFFGEIVE
ncbi:hypothetical protein JXQ70_09485 [bacterium]|nr:hypothetical protein [bacterium]